jgi:hypothetical protein
MRPPKGLTTGHEVKLKIEGEKNKDKVKAAGKKENTKKWR